MKNVFSFFAAYYTGAGVKIQEGISVFSGTEAGKKYIDESKKNW